VRNTRGEDELVESLICTLRPLIMLIFVVPLSGMETSAMISTPAIPNWIDEASPRLTQCGGRAELDVLVHDAGLSCLLSGHVVVKKSDHASS
jgi:hypothetical protein